MLQASLAEQLFGSLQAAIAVAIATTFDDNIYLTGFFSETDRRFRPAHVVAGEIIGFSLLMITSLVLSRLFANMLPVFMVGWLGIVPILLGLYSFAQLFTGTSPRDLEMSQGGRHRPPQEYVQSGFASTKPGPMEVLRDRETYMVSAITISNGGNNLAIYIPLMGNSSILSSLVIICVCYLAVCCWLVLSFRLTRLPGVAVVLSRYASKVFPFVLMWLGFRILGDSGALQAMS